MLEVASNPYQTLWTQKEKNLAWVGGADADRLGQLPAALQHPAAASGQDDGGSDPLQHVQKGSEIDTEGSAL